MGKTGRGKNRGGKMKITLAKNLLVTSVEEEMNLSKEPVNLDFEE
jgi:hypothetical protein